MLTIDATLLAAIQANTGLFAAYIYLYSGNSSSGYTLKATFNKSEIVNYRFGNYDAEFTVTKTAFVSKSLTSSYFGALGKYMYIARGLDIAGTEYLEDSPKFWHIDTRYDSDKQQVTLTFSIFPHDTISVDLDQSVADVLADLIASRGIITYTFVAAQEFSGYDWSPVAETKDIDLRTIPSLMSQKYLANVFNRQGSIYIRNKHNSPSLIVDYTPLASHQYIVMPRENMQSMTGAFWKDENGNLVTTALGLTFPRNLGFLPSTATLSVWNLASLGLPLPSNFKVIQRPDLRLENGDFLRVDPPFTATSADTYSFLANITETFGLPGRYTWQQIVEGAQVPQFIGGAASNRYKIIDTSQAYAINTDRFDGILSEDDDTIQAALETLDNHTHDYTTLTNKPAAETQTNDIFRCNSPGGVSAFAGTIATLPGGATLTYNVTSGAEGAMVPASTSHVGKLRLYNTTRGTSALISNCVTGTNTLTLTANVPAGWLVTDVITIASQTVSVGGLSWVDVEITSGPTGKSALFVNMQILSATPGDVMRLHPLEAYANSKNIPLNVSAANQQVDRLALLKVTSNLFSLSWTGTPTTIQIREAGYLE